MMNVLVKGLINHSFDKGIFVSVNSESISQSAVHTGDPDELIIQDKQQRLSCFLSAKLLPFSLIVFK